MAMVSSARRQLNISKHTSTISCDLVLLVTFIFSLLLVTLSGAHTDRQTDRDHGTCVTIVNLMLCDAVGDW